MKKLRENTLDITNLGIIKDRHLLIQREIEEVIDLEAKDVIPERGIHERNTPETEDPDPIREVQEDTEEDTEIETEREIDLDITPDLQADIEIVVDLDQGESKACLHSSVLYMISFIKSTIIITIN